MSCSQVDVKAYLFGEAAPEVEAHLKVCERCREELERLRLTQGALLALRDEEPPRRIAFVSDAVFEPRWWQRVWRSAPQLGFVSAALLAVAILVHAFVQPAIVVRNNVNTAPIEARLQAGIEKAVAQAETRLAEQTAQRIQAVEKRSEIQRRGDMIAVQSYLIETDKKLNVLYRDIGLRASYDAGGPR